jgi:hypothetical protein
LEAYREDQGDYPSELSDLTPDYIPVIPRSQFGFTAGWRYTSGPGNVRRVGTKGPKQNDIAFPDQVYVLWVWVPTTYTPLKGMLSDALVYHSHEKYARFAYDGVLHERIDGWAYYRE